jgi:hypothetical protein
MIDAFVGFRACINQIHGSRSKNGNTLFLKLYRNGEDAIWLREGMWELHVYAVFNSIFLKKYYIT